MGTFAIALDNAFLALVARIVSETKTCSFQAVPP